MEQITKAEFNEWKENKITKMVMASLEQTKVENQEFISNGGTITKDSTTSTDFIVGRIQGINLVLNIDYEESPEEYNH